MSASDETESAPIADIPVGDPEELAKNPTALKGNIIPIFFSSNLNRWI